MKKFLLFAFACLFTAVACTTNGEEKPSEEPPVPAPKVEFKKEAVAGTKLAITSKELDKDAKFSLVGAVNSDLKAAPSPIGANITLPFTLGKFTLCVDQAGHHFELGELNIKVNAPGVPNEGNQKSNLMVFGDGFSPDAKLILISDKAAEVELETTVGEGFVTVKLPATPGVYKLVVRQAGTEQVLAEQFTVTDKPLTKVMTKITHSDSGTEKFSYEFVYASGKPSKYIVKTQTSDITFNVSVEGDTYTFTDAAGKEGEFQFILENGRVKSSKVGSSTQPWEYNEKGQCTRYASTGSQLLAWESNNIQANGESGLFFYQDTDPKSKTAQDITFMLAKFMDNTMPKEYVVYAAILGGWTGTKSAQIPSQFGNYFIKQALTHTSDDKGFVTKTVLQKFTFEYTYDEV